MHEILTESFIFNLACVPFTHCTLNLHQQKFEIWEDRQPQRVWEKKCNAESVWIIFSKFSRPCRQLTTIFDFGKKGIWCGLILRSNPVADAVFYSFLSVRIGDVLKTKCSRPAFQPDTRKRLFSNNATCDDLPYFSLLILAHQNKINVLECEFRMSYVVAGWRHGRKFSIKLTVITDLSCTSNFCYVFFYRFRMLDLHRNRIKLIRRRFVLKKKRLSVISKCNFRFAGICK